MILWEFLFAGDTDSYIDGQTDMMLRICLSIPERQRKGSGKTYAKRDWKILKLLNLSGRYTVHFTICFTFVYI